MRMKNTIKSKKSLGARINIAVICILAAVYGVLFGITFFYELLKTILPIVIGLLLVVSLLVLYLLQRRIVAPIQEISFILKKFTTYDFSYDEKSKAVAYLNWQDEIGDITRSIVAIQNNMTDLIKTIVDRAKEVNASSQELSATVEEVTATIESINDATKGIASVTEEASAAVQQVHASIEEITSNANELADQASEGAGKSEEIKKNALRAKESGEMSLAETNDMYKEKEARILRAIEAGKIVNDIKVMAETIGGIAEQTNLLSLNAAIEAARAGEHGRGFAVVADEVRKLAEESGKTVSVIRDTTERVQQAFRNLSEDSQEILNFVSGHIIMQFGKFVQASKENYKDAGFLSDTSEALSGMTGEISTAIGEISEAMKNTAQGAENAFHNSREIMSSTDEAAQAMEQVAVTAQQQAELAQKLNEIILEFKV